MDKTEKRKPFSVSHFFPHLVFAVAAICALAFAVHMQGLAAFDSNLVAAVALSRTHTMSNFFLAVSFWGNTMTAVLVLLGLGALYALRNRFMMMLGLFVSVATGAGFAYLLKEIVARPRPGALYAVLSENSYSFPSGHATVAVALYGFLLVLLLQSRAEKAQKITGSVLLVILIALIGISRVYIGVHYPSDILGGYIAGFVGVILGLTTMRALPTIWLKRNRQVRPKNP